MSYAGQPIPEPAPDAAPLTKAQLRAYAAQKRYEREVAGTMDAMGRPIATDRDSQSKMQGTMLAILTSVRTDPSRWKFADGEFATLTNAEALDVCTRAFAHVAAAFAAEDAAISKIEAGLITTLAQVDAEIAAP